MARNLTDQQEQDVARRYLAGEFIQEIADDLGVGRKTIRNALRRQDCPKRDKREAQAHLNQRRRAAGKRHPNYRDGRVKATGGYWLVAVGADDPLFVMAKSRGRLSEFRYGYVLEHRLVMARSLGRPLSSEETVHHVNGDRSDNRLENLQLRTGRHGNGQTMCCADCGSRNIVPIELE